MARSARCLLPLAIAVVLGPAAAGAQGVPATEVLLELRIRHGPRRVVIALARDSAALLPLGEFLDLAGLMAGELDVPARVAGRLASLDVAWSVDVAHGTAQGVEGPFPIDSADAVWRERELFLATPVLSRIFGLQVQIDWTNLVVQLEATEHLPVVQRAIRTRRYETLLASRGGPEPVPLEVRRPFVDGAALDWAITSSTRDPLGAAVFDAALGAAVGGGSLTLEHQIQTGGPGTAHRTTGSWIKAWPERRWLRQIRVGDVLTEGLHPHAVRGAVLTNVPFIREAFFATETLHGAYAPGWEVELYRGDRLVGYTTATESGRFALDLPVQYGPNPFRTVAYGPNGEITRGELTFDIPFRRLPAGQTEYAFGAGDCRLSTCQAAGTLDMRHGLSDRLTVQTGIDGFLRDTLPDQWHPYAAASAAVLRSVSFTAEGVYEGFVRGRLDVTPTPNFQLSVAHTRFDRSVAAPVLTVAGARHGTQVSLFWRPVPARSGFFLQGGANRTVGAAFTEESARLEGTLRVSGVRNVVATRYVRLTPAAGSATWDYRVLASSDWSVPGGPRLVRGLFVQATVGVERAGISVAAAGVGRRVREFFRADVATGWRRGQGGFVELTLTTLLPYLRLNSRNTATTDAGTSGLQFAEGSVLWDSRAERVRFGDGRSVGRAGLAGEVFLDENGDGIRNPDEITVGGVRLQVGPGSLRADSTGRFVLWDLVPFEGTPLEIDTLSLPNPLWLPSFARGRVAAAPNAYQYVPIPVTPGGEIAGTVRFENGAGAGGVTLRLTHLETGDQKTITTFSDGAFYVMGLRPGRWRIMADPDLLSRLGLSAAPVVETLRSAAGGAILEGVVLTVRSR